MINISIIIATRNRESILWSSVEKAIEAIEGMSAEIILINDGDLPLQIPLKLTSKINYFDNDKVGVSSARNYGFSKSSGTILFFVDDDMWINKEAIHWIINFMGDESNIKSVYNLNWEYPLALNKKLAKTKVGKYILSADYNTMWGRMHQKGNKPLSGLYKFDIVTSCSLVIHKNIFNTLKGYNESLIFQGEDVDMSKRINNLSIPIFCVFDTKLYHNQADRLNLDDYLERVSNGYRTQFMAEKAGIIAASTHDYKTSSVFGFDFFRVTEKLWIGLYKLIPTATFFAPLTNRLTGILSGLQRYKQWKNIIGKI